MSNTVSESERCRCGAEFEVTAERHLAEAALGRWEEAHANSCEQMMQQIAPRLQRMAADHAKQEERKIKAKAYAVAYKARKLA